VKVVVVENRGGRTERKRYETERKWWGERNLTYLICRNDWPTGPRGARPKSAGSAHRKAPPDEGSVKTPASSSRAPTSGAIKMTSCGLKRVRGSGWRIPSHVFHFIGELRSPHDILGAHLSC